MARLPADVRPVLAAARSQGLEGIMAKDRRSAYLPGKRRAVDRRAAVALAGDAAAGAAFPDAAAHHQSTERRLRRRR